VLALREIPADPHSAHEADALARAIERRVATRFVDPDQARVQMAGALERLRPVSSWFDIVDDARDDARALGWTWLGAEAEELVVYDVVLDSPDLAVELLPLLVGQARAHGARMLGIGAGPGEQVRSALVSQPGFTVRATNMVLALDAVLTDPAPLALHTMTAAEFDVWVQGEVEAYAEELAATGMSAEAALERSRTQMAELIPSGLDSPGMEFFLARVGDDVVGDLWLNTDQTMAFVYNIEVDEGRRRRGHGAAIMNAAARHCRDAGHPYLGLNVFGHNPHARALYDKLGYRVTHDYYALDLPDAG
jgi:ribosomal protein S18 acetylase RimI-like enzyme